MNYNFVLVEVLCDLRTEQHASARTTYLSCLRGERDLCNLDTGYGSDRELQFCIGGRNSM